MNIPVILASLSLVCGVAAGVSWNAGRVRRRTMLPDDPPDATEKTLGHLWKWGALSSALSAGFLVLVTLVQWGYGISIQDADLPPNPPNMASALASAPEPAPKAERSPPPKARNPRPEAQGAPKAPAEADPARQSAVKLVEMGREVEEGRSYIEARRSYKRATVVDPTYAPGWYRLAAMSAISADATATLEALHSFGALNPDVDLKKKLGEDEDFEMLMSQPDFQRRLGLLVGGEDLVVVLEGAGGPPAEAAPPAAALQDDGQVQPVRNDNPLALAQELNRQGFQAYKEGQADRARSLYFQATKVYPGLAIPWYNLACMEALRGDVEGALEALRRYKALAPGVALVQKVERDRDFDPVRRSDYFKQELLAIGGR